MILKIIHSDASDALSFYTVMMFTVNQTHIFDAIVPGLTIYLDTSHRKLGFLHEDQLSMEEDDYQDFECVELLSEGGTVLWRFEKKNMHTVHTEEMPEQ